MEHPELRILNIAIIICLFLTSALFLFKRKSYPQQLRRFGWFVCLNFIVELAALTLALNNKNNLPLLHFYTLAEFILLSAFFIPLIFPDPSRRRIAFRLAGFIGLLVIVNSIWIQPIRTYNSFSYTLVNLLIIVYCLMLLFRLFNQAVQPDYLHSFYFTVSAALFVYLSGSIFIFMFGSYLEKIEFTSQSTLWIFNALLNLTYQIAILIIWWRMFRQSSANRPTPNTASGN
jgi:hypothetical protein